MGTGGEKRGHKGRVQEGQGAGRGGMMGEGMRGGCKEDRKREHEDRVPLGIGAGSGGMRG